MKRKRGKTGKEEEREHKRGTLSLAVAPPAACANGIRSGSSDAATLAAGLIGRAAAVFCVDEVVVYSDGQCSPLAVPFVARVLRYLETPQYLRKHLMPMHSDLKRAGLLPPLDAPHQPRQHECTLFREGAGVHEPDSYNHDGSLDVHASEVSATTHFADVGLSKLCYIDPAVHVHERTTVAMEFAHGKADKKRRKKRVQPGRQSDTTASDSLQQYAKRTDGLFSGRVVQSSAPRVKHGRYWSFNVREASGLHDALNKCPFAKQYSCRIGTSEHANTVQHQQEAIRENKGKHMIVALGGQHGLEAAAAADSKLNSKSVADLFDFHVNCIPGQGSRTVRTEEAAFACLAALQPSTADR